MKFPSILAISVVVVCVPGATHAQQLSTQQNRELAPAQENVPPAAQRAADATERNAKRFALGVQGGVGLDPEILDVGVHAAFGPVFHPNLTFRPVVEIGLGEITTLLGINLDVLYTLGGYTRDTQWIPYIGGGPNFGLSHRGFETENGDNVDGPDGDDDGSRFDFGDTDFNGGVNFIVGMRKQSGVFFEMKATAWGVSNIRLLAGFNF
jgi:hypothetical protein